MSKSRMIFYGALGSLVSVLIWSFIGGCHTSSPKAPAPPPAGEAAYEEIAPPAPISENTLVEEGIIPGDKPETPSEPVPAASAAVPETEPAASRFHTVAKGETLWGISRQYGVSLKSIEEANKLDDPDRLSVGQRLVIP